MKRLSVVLLCLCSWLAYAADNVLVHVKRSDSSFVIHLPANATTGYQWNVVRFNKALLDLKSHQYTAPQSKVMGAGGEASFTFLLQHAKSLPKSTELVFRYARPWEAASSGKLTKVTVVFD